MDDSGNISEKPINLKPEPEFVKHVSECRFNATGSDYCDKAFQFNKCGYQKCQKEDVKC